nr:unnamed protein product [Callosobruchus analis]
MLIIPRINTYNNISRIQSYSNLLFGRTVLNNQLPQCRMIRYSTKVSTLHI